MISGFNMSEAQTITTKYGSAKIILRSELNNPDVMRNAFARHCKEDRKSVV